MKAKRILPLLAAAALLAGCFKDVSYKTNYVLKPLAQAQTVDPVEPFEGLKAYAFDADTAFYTVASYEDALNGVIARKDGGCGACVEYGGAVSEKRGQQGGQAGTEQ